MLLLQDDTNKQALFENSLRFLETEIFRDHLSKKISHSWEEKLDSESTVDYDFYWHEEEFDDEL